MDSNFLSGAPAPRRAASPGVAELGVGRRVCGAPLSDFGARLVGEDGPKASGRLGDTSGVDTFAFAARPLWVVGVVVKRDWPQGVASSGVVAPGERSCRAGGGGQRCGR